MNEEFEKDYRFSTAQEFSQAFAEYHSGSFRGELLNGLIVENSPFQKLRKAAVDFAMQNNPLHSKEEVLIIRESLLECAGVATNARISVTFDSKGEKITFNRLAEQLFLDIIYIQTVINVIDQGDTQQNNQSVLPPAPDETCNCDYDI